LVRVGAALLIAVVPLVWPRGSAGDRIAKADKAPPSWPMFGGSPGRNMVNVEPRDVPVDWCVEGKRKNVKWMAELGSRTVGSPVVAQGKVFVATNNARPRDPNVRGHKAVLMAFREKDGQLVWQIADDVPAHWTAAFSAAVSSPPTVDGDSLYYVTSAGQVVCADTERGQIKWRYDMVKELQVHTYSDSGCAARIAPPWSSPLVVGDLVFTATGNGIDAEQELPAPGAPSFIALNKRTGKLAWQSNLPGANTIQCHWSSPAFSDHGGRPQVIFAGGDGVIYSFAPETGALLWRCDCLPARKKKTEPRIDNQFVASPVVVANKLYVGMGVAADDGRGTPRWSYFLCLDITKQGDVSLRNYDAKSPDNKASALVWAFGGPVERPRKGSRGNFHPTVSTAAVDDGLVYIAEELGYVDCLDAATGNRIWVYDLEAAMLGSPYVVKNHVYVGTDDGEVLVFRHRRAARLVTTIDMGERITATPAAANGTLYVTTESKLYAIASK
jgi:outer membrane protein assembly factor BamB